MKFRICQCDAFSKRQVSQSSETCLPGTDLARRHAVLRRHQKPNELFSCCFNTPRAYARRTSKIHRNIRWKKPLTQYSTQLANTYQQQPTPTRNAYSQRPRHWNAMPAERLPTRDRSKNSTAARPAQQVGRAGAGRARRHVRAAQQTRPD